MKLFNSLAVTLAVIAATAAPAFSADTDARSQRVRASVRIGKQGGCSGTIIARGKRYAYGLSAAHCCGSLKSTFTFGNPDGSEGRGRWIAVDRKRDLALFVAWARDVLAVVPVPKQGYPDWRQGVDAVGYPGGSGPKWKRFRYRGENQIRSTNGSFRRAKYDNLGPGRFGGGDSGGGVFYDGNFLIGVMTHGGQHAATLDQVRTFLKAQRDYFDDVEPFG